MSRVTLLQAALTVAESMLQLAQDYQWDALAEKEKEERALCAQIQAITPSSTAPSATETQLAREIIALHGRILEIAEPMHEDLRILLQAWLTIEPAEA